MIAEGGTALEPGFYWVEVWWREPWDDDTYGPFLTVGELFYDDGGRPAWRTTQQEVHEEDRSWVRHIRVLSARLEPPEFKKVTA